jgi:3-hydroxyacyl-[acyl-carrier-protein] dehydratase
MELKLNKDEILNTLHHRPPYLMVDEVQALTKNKIIATKTPLTEEHYIQGHFPGAHVVPGAMMQEMSTQTAGILLTKFYSPVPNYNSNTTKGHALGVLKKINYAKYRNFAKPNQPIRIEVELINQQDNLFEFKATLYQNDQWIMKNSFHLVNIEDAPLLN